MWGIALALALALPFLPSRPGLCQGSGRNAFAPAAEAAGRCQEVRVVSPIECLPQVEDYTYMWWADGFRGRSADGRWLRCIQTGRYAMAMDVERVEIVHLGPLPRALSYQDALTQGDEVMAGLPPAELRLTIVADGTEYRCTQGGAYTVHSGPRLIESGRFLQRADITDLVFEDATGHRLDVKARLEIVAWPDRLALLLAAEPAAERSDDAPGWKDAAVEIRLGLGATVIADRVAARPGEVWAYGETRTAAVSVAPAGDGMAAAPDPPRVEVVAAAIPGGRPCPVEYDAARGWHRIDLDLVDAVGEHNDSVERVRLSLVNRESRPATARLLFDKSGSAMRVQDIAAITGISPMLRDAEGFPAGIPVQISKNWHRQRDLDLVYQGAWLHGFTMLHLPARSEVELEFTLAYAHWGGVAAASHAQLCLVGWGHDQLWDESAIGSWGESICYEPDQVQAECSVLDVRPLMVYVEAHGQPLKWHWTNNVGGGDFVRYFDAQGRRQHPARMKALYRRYCPDLTEVTYAGRSEDRKIEHRVTVSIHRTDDIVRGIYHLRMEVKEPVEFSRFVIFQTGADTYSYTGEHKMALGNEKGLVREWETQWGGSEYRTERMRCAGRIPWVSLHEPEPQTDGIVHRGQPPGSWANRGVIIREWEARLGGEAAEPWAAEYGVKARGVDVSVIDILPPPGVSRLLPGDYVEATFEHVVMPQYARDYYGPNENLRAALERGENTWRMIHREALGNDLAVQVSEGTLERVWPTSIRAASDRAQFTITGGLGYAPVTISGLSDYRSPILEMREPGGPWRRVDQSVHGNDFWQADYVEATRTWEITYTVPLDTPGDERRTRELRFRMEKAG